MSEQIPVLDHGYVRFVESWGRGDANEPEAGIIEAARQSTQGCFRGWDKDQKLLEFLFNSNPPHATPFEFAGMVIEVQAPILVFREWHRHRTQSYNEMSARYSPLPDLNYLPSLDRLFLVDPKNKQSTPVDGSESLQTGSAELWLTSLRDAYRHVEHIYQLGLHYGVPKEVARVILPVGRYSRMRASTCLRNWLSFLTLRYHPKAQWEIRQFATVVGEQIISQEFPRTWALFKDNRLSE